MIPHLKERPLILYRVHGDIYSPGFYQQKISSSAPAWMSRVTVKKEGGVITHPVCNNEADMVCLANQNSITPHVWLSRQDQPEKPDQMIFDLDPADDDFVSVRTGAFTLKSLQETAGLIPFVKTTGSRGPHIVVPLDCSASFTTVRRAAKEIVRRMIAQSPDLYTVEHRKEKRRGRIFIDTLRNAYGHTAVAAHAIRTRDGALVAAPLFWKELKGSGLTAQSYNLRNILAHLEKPEIPGKIWENIGKS